MYINVLFWRVAQHLLTLISAHTFSKANNVNIIYIKKKIDSK